MPDSYWSLDDAINAFVEAMQARPYIQQNEIQVADSWPGETTQLRSIWVDGAKGVEEVAGMRAGPIKNNENYAFFVVCDSRTEGGTTKEAREALTPLVGEVFREFAESKRIQLTDDKVIAARVAGWRYDPYVMKEGRGVCCTIEIRVTGRR